MKKRGFTLVELLAVIIIIAIISLIIFPLVSKQLGKSKEDLYEIQVQNIIKAAKAKAMDDKEFIEEAKFGPIYVSVEQLQNMENTEGATYLESGTITNPIDNTPMYGYVKITYDDSIKSYVYEYLESLENEGNTTLTQAAKYVISKQSVIYTNEQESDEIQGGLYIDTETNMYYFKGTSPNNWISVDGALWRIINIDKETYEMKIAKTINNAKVTWDESENGLTDFTLSNSELKMYNYLNEYPLNEKLKKQIKEKATWNIGSVSTSTKTIKDARLEEENVTVTSSVGLLTVSDYAYATRTLSCRKDYTKDLCSSDNYLAMSEQYFLMNTVKGETNVWTISSDGLSKVASSKTLTVVPTVQLSATAKVISGTGTSTDPYVLNVN